MEMGYMRKRTRYILITVVSVALIMGVPLAIIAHSTSPYKVVEKDEIRLDYNTRYKYIALVNKSIIYYNRDIIDMNEPLYIPLTRTLNFTMKFTVDSPLNEIRGTRGLVNLRIRLTEPEGWSILLNNTTYTIDSMDSTIKFSVNISEIRNIIGSIRKEIGSSSLEYDVEIDPIIKTSTLLQSNVIDRIIEPKMTLVLDFQRNKIIYDNLNFTDTYKKASRQVVPETLAILGLTSITVQDLRYVSYALIISGVLSALLFIVMREKKLVNIVDALLHKYDNIIVRATSVTSSSRRVLVKDFRELLRISRLLGKPIVYYKEGSSHIFTVIDAETLYILSLNDKGESPTS